MHLRFALLRARLRSERNPRRTPSERIKINMTNVRDYIRMAPLHHDTLRLLILDMDHSPQTRRAAIDRVLTAHYATKAAYTPFSDTPEVIYPVLCQLPPIDVCRLASVSSLWRNEARITRRWTKRWKFTDASRIQVVGGNRVFHERARKRVHEAFIADISAVLGDGVMITRFGNSMVALLGDRGVDCYDRIRSYPPWVEVTKNIRATIGCVATDGKLVGFSMTGGDTDSVIYVCDHTKVTAPAWSLEAEHEDTVYGISMIPGAILAGDRDGGISYSSTLTGASLAGLRTHSGQINSVKLTSKWALCASSVESIDPPDPDAPIVGVVYVFSRSDLDSRQWPVRHRLKHDDAVWSVAVDYSEEVAATACEDGNVYIWSMSTFVMLRAFRTEHTCYSVAISYEFVVSGHEDGTLRVWPKNGASADATVLHLPVDDVCKVCSIGMSLNRITCVVGWERGENDCGSVLCVIDAVDSTV